MPQIEQVDRHAIEYYGYGATGGGCGCGGWGKDYTEAWLNKLRQDPELWAAHLAREAEHEQKITRNLKY